MRSRRSRSCGLGPALSAVVPAQAGTHCATHRSLWNMGPRLRGDDSGAPGTAREPADTLLRDRDPLHLEHHFRLREALHRDGGAGGEILAEQLGAQFRHACGVAGVDEKHRHGHHVGELGARLCQGLLDVAEGLLELGVEIADERFPGVIDLAGVAGDVDRPRCALGDDARRERTLDLPGAANERFFHGFLHLPQRVVPAKAGTHRATEHGLWDIDPRFRGDDSIDVERSNYFALPWWIARHSRSGVAGISMWRMPRCESASTSALATAGMAPTQPASPAPLTPSGLVRVGTGLLLTSTALMSVARGMA